MTDTGGRLERWLLRGWRPYLWIALLGLLVYGRSLSFGFTSLDDVHLVRSNYAQLGDLRNAGRAFASDVFWKRPGAYYRPLLTLSLMADAQWSGTNARGYHLTNILLHALAACLLFLLLQGLGASRLPSFLAALLFACHPVLAQAVCWIPGRNDILLAIAVWCGLLALIRYTKDGSARWLALHGLALLLALFVKELAVVLPAAGLLYLLLAADQKPTRGRWLLLVAVWSAGLVLWFVARRLAIGAGSAFSLTSFATPREAALGLLSYLGKIALPVNLSVLPHPDDARPLYGAVALAGLAALALARGVADRGRFWFGLSWFALFLIPSFIKTDSEIHFLEHRLYLPLAGLLLAVLETNAVRNARRRRLAPAAAVLVVLCSVATVVHSRVFTDQYTFWQSAARTSPHSLLAWRGLGQRYYEAGEYRQAERALEQGLRLAPDDVGALYHLGLVENELGQYQRARDALDRAAQQTGDGSRLAMIANAQGIALERQGDLAAAHQQFLRSLSYDPGNEQHNAYLSHSFILQARYDSALVYFQRALALGFQPDSLIRREYRYVVSLNARPGDVTVLDSLGLLYLQVGEPQRAAAVFERLRRGNPRSFHAWAMLGRALASAGHADGAEAAWQRAIKLEPGHSWVDNDLAMLYAGQGKYGQAERVLSQLLRREPGNALAVNNLAGISLSQGKWRQAEALFLRYQTLAPDDPAGYDNLAVLYYQTGRLDQAETQFRQAESRAPTDPKIQYHCYQLYAALHDSVQADRHYRLALRYGFRSEAAGQDGSAGPAVR